MKKILLFIALALLLSPRHLVSAQALQSEQALKKANASAVEPKLVTKRLASLRSVKVTEGSRVMITSDAPLSDYGAYRNGDFFCIELPQSDATLVRGGLHGIGFTDTQVESRGGNVIITFHLEQGVSASVSQKFNRLDVTFTSSNGQSSNVALQVSATKPLSVATVSAPLGNSVSANAARQSATPKVNKVSDADADLSIPESITATVLGLTPQTVTRPLTPKQLYTTFINGVDQSGNFQTGIALDTSLFMVLRGAYTDINDYNTSYPKRFLYRFQTSLATAKGATKDDKSIRLALGFNITLWDRGDLRTDTKFIGCMEAALVPPPLQGPPSPDQEAAAEAAIKPGLQSCRDKARERHWNASSVMFAWAPSWVSKTGKTSDFSGNGGGYWSSLSYGFEDFGEDNWFRKHAQFVLHARYRTNEQVADPDNQGQFFSRDSIFYGGRLRGGDGDTTGNIEYVFFRSRRHGSSYDNATRLTIGFERRIAENVWFALSAGGENGRRSDNSQGFVMTSFKWSLEQKKPKQ